MTPELGFPSFPQEMEVDVDSSRGVKIAFNGEQITKGGDPDDVFTVFENLITAVRAGDAAGIDMGRAALQRVFDRVSTAQGRVGADMRTIEEQKLRLAEL